MALWKHDVSNVVFEDEQTTQPGEPGFTREFAMAHFKDEKFSYLGTPNRQPREAPVAEEILVEEEEVAMEAVASSDPTN